VFLGIVSLSCILPFVYVLALSLSSNTFVVSGQVGFWPKGFTIKSYEHLMQKIAFWNAFRTSVLRVVIGTILSMFFTITLAYPLSKEKDQFRMRTIYVWIIFFTMLFNGGVIPAYMLINALGLMDTIWALTLSCAVQVFNIVLMLNFYKQIPKEMEEAAYIDGANHFTILFRIYVPLSMASIATLTLFTIVMHWNSWFDGMLYMNRVENYPLQTYLRTIIISLDMTAISTEDIERLKSLNNKSLRAAQIILATIPILCVYPFLQRYFVTGIVLGSVKG